MTSLGAASLARRSAPAAFAFEAAIAALTHKLAKHIESTPRYTAGRVRLRRILYQYLNAYAVVLLVAVWISAARRSGVDVEIRCRVACQPQKGVACSTERTGAVEGEGTQLCLRT